MFLYWINQNYGYQASSEKTISNYFFLLIIIIRNPQAIHIYNKPHNDYITNIKKI